jgi:lauroyl/myristoyl acyltransferase
MADAQPNESRASRAPQDANGASRAALEPLEASAPPMHPWVEAAFAAAQSDYGRVEQGIQEALEIADEISARFADAWCMWRVWSRQNWIDFAQSQASITKDRIEATSLRGLDELAEGLKASSAGIVLTSPHMGDYLHMCAKFLTRFPERRILVYRRRPPSEIDRAVLARFGELGLRVDLVVTGPDAAMRMNRSLKAGAIAVLMFDLPCIWGQTTPVSFLGRDAHFVAGPATLAMRTASHLVPVGAVQRHDGPQGFLGRISSTESHRSRSSVQAMTARLVEDLERMLVLAPDQWLHWNFLPEFRAGSTSPIEGD